ncbi:hypothetical protein [Limnochorda pilosa]|uniref:hypothetical protein n=1 Tax=Limnochorda pilosa TaxID=1555112 RepID=UPI00082C5AA0|nr:hypothetical protein [Limnochorda pilosa]
MWIYNPAGIRPDGQYVDELLSATMREMGLSKPPMAGQFPKARVERMTVESDVLDEVNRLFYERGWSDGLPIVPPTAQRVAEMLRGADLSPDVVVATLPPMGGQATIEKIAVNAVMAGCRPVDMPLLIAATEALADPAFDLRGLATTTSPDTPMVIVSGPIVSQLGLNAGTNALGRGWRGNAVVGRALHLIVQNIGGSWPGVTDLSCLGYPGDFTMVLAENAEASPWAPFHTDLGFSKRANVVSVVGAEGTHNILGIGQGTRGFMKLVAAHLAGMDRPIRSVVVLIVAQDTAQQLAEEGWTPKSMRAFIQDNAAIPFYVYKERFIDTGMARRVPDWVHQTQSPDELIPTPLIEQMLILVSGGPGEKSMVVPGWPAGSMVSREIRLPWNWDELVEAYVPDYDR